MIGLRGAMGLAAMLLAIAAGPAAPERVVAGDRIISATVAGTPARLLVDAAAPAFPILSPDFVERAQLQKGLFGVGFKIGTVVLRGRSSVREIALDGNPFKRRILWFDRPMVPGVDGVIGPSALPDDIVRFQLRAEAPGDRRFTLPMVDAGGMFGGILGLFGQIEVAGQPIRIRFDLRHRRTLATAGAGSIVAQALGGKLQGGVEPEEIAFGVERPVRRLALARPLAIGAFALSEMGVRVSDAGTVGAVPDADHVPDPDEIIVVAQSNKKRNHDRDQIRLGRDRLDACASIVFDKPAKLIRLTCA